MAGEGLISIWDALSSNLKSIGFGVVNSIPGLVAAAVILVLGYVVAWVVWWVVRNGLDRLEFDKYVVDKTGLRRVAGSLQLGNLLAQISKWYTLVLFLAPAAEALPQTLNRLGDFFRFLQNWVPNLIVAVLIGIVGLLVGEYVSDRISETKARSAGLLASIVKVVVWVFTVLTVLDQIGVKVDLAQNSVLIILGGVMLAIAIGFGLALKDHASAWLKEVRKHW